LFNNYNNNNIHILSCNRS